MLDVLDVLGEVRDRGPITARQLADDTGERMADVVDALDHLAHDHLVDAETEPQSAAAYTVSEIGLRALADEAARRQAGPSTEPERLL